MEFNKHSNLRGLHAFLGASNYHWINYDKEKLTQSYFSSQATQRGTELHEFACTCIRLGQKLPRSKLTLNMFVNDAIGFGMTPEQPLYYSQNIFGTADAISFKGTLLRISDYKSGVTPASFHQLEIYAALFCHEYRIRPGDIQTELRIYQNDDFETANPDASVILPIMDKMVTFDQIIEEMKRRDLS